jgi:hypothetical protein
MNKPLKLPENGFEVLASDGGGKMIEKKKTNADKNRSMTDEELANLLSTAWNKADYEDDDYDPAWLKWLRLPAEQEGLR